MNLSNAACKELHRVLQSPIKLSGFPLDFEILYQISLNQLTFNCIKSKNYLPLQSGQTDNDFTELCGQKG